MSRTYRRRGAEADHKYYFNFKPTLCYSRYEYISWHQHNYPELTEERAKRKHVATFYTDGYRTMTTPMWFYRTHHQVPLRRKERDLLRNVLKSKHLDELEAVVWPHYKKPHIYFW